MKRTIPLMITAVGGILLIVATFIPATKDWGEKATIWFDILAGIAFILGGVNLLMIHLSKVSDRKKGWAYSLITLLSFLTMLFAGLFKIGSPPAPDQEFYGESFAPLTISQLPDSATFTIPGEIPATITDHIELPASVRTQMTVADGTITFRGWMRPNQLNDLIDFSDNLKWRATMEALAEKAKPQVTLTGSLDWYSDHRALSYGGVMTPEDRTSLEQMGSDAPWKSAIDQLDKLTNKKISLNVKPEDVPPAFINGDKPATVAYESSGQLTATGDMTTGTRDTLKSVFPVVRPMTPEQQQAYWQSLVDAGEKPLDDDARQTFIGILDTLWTKQQLVDIINAAGIAKPGTKSWTQLYEEQQAGVADLNPEIPAGESVTLNDAQLQAIDAYIAAPQQRISQLVINLKAAGTLTGGQQAAMTKYLSSQPTSGRLGRDLTQTLMDKNVSLDQAQLELLLGPYRSEMVWARIVERLFIASHVVKYPYSGEYNATGTPFWWMYEYIMQPLMATVFALLAFYVASAAFRAFRVKNVEASLLLGTAFIILLGRTFAGVWLTSWIDPAGPFSGFRIENMTVWIMSVINTAGNRAIFIGIALGIISTSVKVLLGVDRSYLGSDD